MVSKVHKLYGFTLLELMVSISIGMLTIGAIIANYNGYNNRQSLKQAALTLKNNLRFAQAKAFSGEKPASSCTELVGWRVSFASGSYTMQAECAPQGLQGTSTTMTLPSGITFSPIPAAITFRVLSRGSDLTAAGFLNLVGFNQTYTLEISPGGDISDEGLQ